MRLCTLYAGEIARLYYSGVLEDIVLRRQAAVDDIRRKVDSHWLSNYENDKVGGRWSPLFSGEWQDFYLAEHLDREVVRIAEKYLEEIKEV